MVVTGKGRTLDVIVRELPEIPIPRFVRLPPELSRRTLFGRMVADRKGKEAARLARSVGYPLIIRSDAAFEDGLGRSFAGLFLSLPIGHPSELADALDRVRSNGGGKEGSPVWRWQRVEEYAKDRGVAVERGAIDVILQRHIRGDRAIITEHPHIPDAYFFSAESPSALGGWKKEEYFFPTMRRAKEVVEESKWGKEVMRALHDFRKVRTLFPAGIAYQAEVTLCDYAFVQWRPFRRRQRAGFDLEDVAPPLSGRHVYDIPLVLGLTPPAGVDCAPGEWASDSNRISQSMIPRSTGPIPKASFFGGERENSCPYEGSTLERTLPWQTHDLFRFMERESLVGMSEDAMPATSDGEWAGHSLRVWSDGRRARAMLYEAGPRRGEPDPGPSGRLPKAL